MIFATINDVDEIVALYRDVIETVNKTDVKLGWNIDVYPDETFVRTAVENSQMCVLKEDNRIIAVAVVNHNVNAEYDDIDWKIKSPKERISTIHALATAVDRRGKTTSDMLLMDIADYCRRQNDLAIHLDVIDTNIPAYKMYLRNGYNEMACIDMYYEVVGTRQFWMLEKVL